MVRRESSTESLRFVNVMTRGLALCSTMPTTSHKRVVKQDHRRQRATIFVPRMLRLPCIAPPTAAPVVAHLAVLASKALSVNNQDAAKHRVSKSNDASP